MGAGCGVRQTEGPPQARGARHRTGGRAGPREGRGGTGLQGRQAPRRGKPGPAGPLFWTVTHRALSGLERLCSGLSGQDGDVASGAGRAWSERERCRAWPRSGWVVVCGRGPAAVLWAWFEWLNGCGRGVRQTAVWAWSKQLGAWAWLGGGRASGFPRFSRLLLPLASLRLKGREAPSGLTHWSLTAGPRVPLLQSRSEALQADWLFGFGIPSTGVGQGRWGGRDSCVPACGSPLSPNLGARPGPPWP